MSDDDTPPADSPDTAEEPPPPPLLRLRDELPDVVESIDALTAYADALAAGSGPVALDAERASGYTYSQRAYLIQVRREGAGTALIDPIAFDDLAVLDAAIGETEWILHAATQDLPCLREVGLHPRKLFDTELAGRLLNLPRVGLATLVERSFGVTMAKEHSAVNWSTRPLPESWLEYAALDVEVLAELRDLLNDELAAAGKLDWAEQEFEALLSFAGPPVREEPWRRVSGLHRARGARALGIARGVWEARDSIARQRDVSPGRIMPDASIVELAVHPPKTMAELRGMQVMRNRGPRRFTEQWLEAVQGALALDDAELPAVGPAREGPPPPRAWNDKFPEAAGRLARCRAFLAATAEAQNLPVENLLSPALVRGLAWQPPDDAGTEAVSGALLAGGARRWQVELAVDGLTHALLEPRTV